MTITILLPVYNAGPYLRKAIASVLYQTHQDFELMLIDDASKDHSANTIRDYAERDARIRPIFHRANVGLAATLNEGLKAANTDLVARMDQDDECLTNRLAVQIAYMEANPEVVVSGSYVYHMGARRDLDRLVELPVSFGEIVDVLPKYNCLYHPSVVMRRREILDLGGYRPEFLNAEDYDLWLRTSRVHRLANIPQALLRYRFSIRGMTLARKWEQLSYVVLAQTAHQYPLMPLDELRAIALQRLADSDRSYFFREVAKGTLSELAALGHWVDASIVAWRLRTEIGPRRSLRYLRAIGRSIVLRQPLQPVS